MGPVVRDPSAGCREADAQMGNDRQLFGEGNEKLLDKQAHQTDCRKS